MEKLYYSWSDLETDCRIITREMAIEGYRPDVVIGPGRGGYPMGVMMSHYFIVDDINDTGTTLNGIFKVIEDFDVDNNNLMIKAHQDITVCTLFNKTMSSFKNVDYYARECTPDYDPWIVFPYEEWWI